MSVNYAYTWAEIDPETNMCICVDNTTSSNCPGENWVALPVYDEDYVLKYYIDGNWYEDAAGTIPWTSSLLK